jgi:hypothetical protein
MAEQGNGNPDDLRYEMDATRARLSETAEQLGDALDARTESVRETLASAGDAISGVRDRIRIGELVQRHPLPALGIAIGLGFLLSATGADRAAATGTSDAARRATKVAGDTVRRRRERARQEKRLEEHRRSLQPREPGLIERLTDGILSAINVDGLVAQLRDAAGAPSESRSPGEVSRNRLANHEYWRDKD